MSSIPGEGDTIQIFNAQTGHTENVVRVIKSEEEWRAIPLPEHYEVARKKGTEYAFTGKYHACKKPGIYTCACCGTDLFDSQTKFDSGNGWPSFFAPVSDLNITLEPDLTGEMARTEVLCARCDAHLGHVFETALPPPSNGTV